MSSGEFQLGDIFDGEEFDGEAATREAARFLERWTHDDLTNATRRTRRLSALGVAGALVATFLPTTTGIAEVVLDAVFYTLVVEVAAMGSVYYLLRHAYGPADVLEGDLDALETVGLLVLLAMAYGATNARVGRLLWRYVFKSATFAPGGRPPRLEDDGTESVLVWGRRVGTLAAVIVVADVTWFIATRTPVGPVVYGYLTDGSGGGGGGGVEWGSGPTTLELGALYGVVFLLGILLAVTLSVRR